MRPVARVDTRGGDRHKGPAKRGIRVEDNLWDAVKARTEADGYETLNEAVVDLLEWYVDRPAHERKVR